MWVYAVVSSPTHAAHVSCFRIQATIAFAEASQTALDIRFSDPAEPIVVSVDNELSETLFVIASSQLQSVSQRGSQRSQRNEGTRDNGGAIPRGKKRPLEDDT